GGLRWWFVCPLEADGRPCGRRVRKLYLPAGATLFGCRHCHRLSYTSSQRSRYDEPVFRRLARYMGWGFAEGEEMMRGDGAAGWGLTGCRPAARWGWPVMLSTGTCCPCLQERPHHDPDDGQQGGNGEDDAGDLPVPLLLPPPHRRRTAAAPCC